MTGGGGGVSVLVQPFANFKPRRAGSSPCIMGETIHDAHSQKKYTELCKILKFGVNQANIY